MHDVERGHYRWCWQKEKIPTILFGLTATAYQCHDDHNTTWPVLSVGSLIFLQWVQSDRLIDDDRCSHTSTLHGLTGDGKGGDTLTR
jgi:hypothetical protein